MVQALDQQARLRRAAEPIWEMADVDPQLGALKPKDGVSRRPIGLCRAPALGSRDYEIAVDGETGARTRRYLPAYRTIRYGEMTARSKPSPVSGDIRTGIGCVQ